MLRKLFLLVMVCLLVSTAAVGAQQYTNLDGLIFNYDAATYTVTEAGGVLSVMNNRSFQTFTAYLNTTALGIAGGLSSASSIDQLVAGYNRTFGVAITLDTAQARTLELTGGAGLAVPYTQGGLRGVVLFALYEGGEVIIMDGVTTTPANQPALIEEGITLLTGMSYGGTPALSDPNAEPLIRLVQPLTPSQLPPGVATMNDLVVFEYPAAFRLTGQPSDPLLNLVTLNAFPSGTNVSMTLGEASDLVNGQTWKTMFVTGLAIAAGDNAYDPATSWTTLAGSLGSPAAGAVQQGLSQAQSQVGSLTGAAGSLTGAAQGGLSQAGTALTEVPALGGAEYPVVEVYQALNPNGLSVLAYVVTLNADLYVTISANAINPDALTEQRPLLDEMALSLRLISQEDVAAYGFDVQ